jgi:hypothetical protein
MKPKAATSEGWRSWEKQAAQNHPIRYWFAEEGLDKIQNVLCYPVDKLYDIKYWFNNRFISKTHALNSNLEKGIWHEFDTRLLHCMFDELVNFVEIEQAWYNIAWDKEARDRYKVPFYSWGWFRWRVWRSPEAGIESLEWASKLVMDEGYGVEPGDPEYGKPTRQAQSAQEILTLYRWWKEVYPNRPDAYDVSGWTAYCEQRRQQDLKFLEEDRTPAEAAVGREAIKIANQIEDQYEKEDEEMMVRLVKIRGALWV